MKAALPENRGAPFGFPRSAPPSERLEVTSLDRLLAAKTMARQQREWRQDPACLFCGVRRSKRFSGR